MLLYENAVLSVAVRYVEKQNYPWTQAFGGLCVRVGTGT